jgi:hypothetical protein
MELHWLEGRAMPYVGGVTGVAGSRVIIGWRGGADSGGVTWGVPWPEGKYPKDTKFELKTEAGTAVPMQSWPLATWPDGSLKWSAHAIAAGGVALTNKLTLEAGKEVAPAKGVTVAEDEKAFTIDTGVIQCRVAKSGEAIIESISRDGKIVAQNGKLVCMERDAAEAPVDGTWKQTSFTGEIGKVTVEQRGPVRAVVKIEGMNSGSGKKWLPFVVRLYFYAGAESVRVMHTMIFDGDADKDFISGLGLRFSVPMRGALYDRHVRFAGDDNGVFGEAVQGLTGLRRDPGDAVRAAQIAGEAAPAVSTWNPQVSGALDLIPVFGDYSLFQPTADSFEIRKRTKEGFTWINSGYGHRAAGLGYVGTPQGGMAFGIRNFWQSEPDELSIRGAGGDAAEVTLWLWSPQARPMDLRFYHDEMGEDTYAKQLKGLDITYEDYEPGFGTATGIARTSEMTLWALPGTPSQEAMAALANEVRTPAQIVARPEDYHAAKVFGGAIWNVVDRSTPSKARIEDQLDWYFDFYKHEVEQRHWYGYWYYGNVMHSYDVDRHVWRYDVGGFAWDNSELSTDLWLWYSFLRTGRADIFRMAEAMTRQTGEVEVYHLGKFAGLGTRHGVVPWGDSAKQLRISTAENRRFYYYLTADERVGDLLWEEVNADRTAGVYPPDRKIQKAADFTGKPYKMELTVGTDWGSVSAALMTAWERTGDAKYKDKLVTSMKSIAGLKHGWFTGSGGYDPETGRFYTERDGMDVGHLSIVFGGFEMNAELLQNLDVPEYEKTWVSYCRLYNATPEEQQAALGAPLGKLNLAQGHSRATAYAAWKTHDDALAARAWKEFFAGVAGLKIMREPFPVRYLTGPEVLNPVKEIGVTTNAVAQFGLAAIEDLGLVGDKIPAQVPGE